MEYNGRILNENERARMCESSLFPCSLTLRSCSHSLTFCFILPVRSRRITIASDFISIEQAIIINITKCHFQEACAVPCLRTTCAAGCSMCTRAQFKSTSTQTIYFCLECQSAMAQQLAMFIKAATIEE